MIIKRLFEMVSAKKEQYCFDILQSLLFDTLVTFHDSQFKEYCNTDDEAAYFITDCYTYITRDRQLALDSITEAELYGASDEEFTQLLEDLKTQDTYYCKGIVSHRILIFNNEQ